MIEIQADETKINKVFEMPNLEGFIKKYYNALISISDEFKKYKPDYIIALTRKGPRILELMRLSGIWTEDITIISDKALDFIPSEQLNGKNIIIFDDIIISGTTINNLISKFEKKYNANIKVVCLAIDEETISDEAIPHKFEFYHKINFTKAERFVFCNDVVQSFSFLNKPYDLDYSMFYSLVESDFISSLLSSSNIDKGYDITTTYQHNNAFSRYSFIPDNSLMEDIFKNIFQECDVFPKLCKVRVYHNDSTGECTLVPIVVFSIDQNKIKKGNIFSNNFLIYNDLINKARDYIDKSNEEMALYKLTWYIVSYIYGLSFHIRNSTENNKILPFSFPSQFLHYQDLLYLFGPNLSEYIIRFLDSHYLETIDILKNLSIPSSKLKLRNYEETKFEFQSSSVFDKKRRVLYNEISKHIDEHISVNDSISNQLATIFEGLFFIKEIPTQEKVRQNGIRGSEHKRLEVGFNYEQIEEILINKGVLSQNDNNYQIDLSLAFDFLVDTGVQIPIFYKSEDGLLERAYHYGEDALSAKRYGFLIASVTKQLFKYKIDNKNIETLNKISFEKIGVILQEEISKSGLIVVLREQIDSHDRQLHIFAPSYSRHGRILHISDEAYDSSINSPFMFNEWCNKEGIIQYGHNEKNVVYSDDWFKKNTKIPLIAKDSSAPFESFVILLKHIDNIDRDFLIALATCVDNRSYVEALREELKLFFKSNTYSFSLPLNNLLVYLNNGKFQIEGKYFKSILVKLRTKSYSAVNDVRHKKKLWENMGNILIDIENYFENCGFELNSLYKQNLSFYIEKINTNHKSVIQPPVSQFNEKIIILGELGIRLSSILVSMLELSDKVFNKKRETKDGNIHKTDLKIINRFIGDFTEHVDSWNNYLKEKSNIHFNGIYVDTIPRINYDLLQIEHFKNSEGECFRLMEVVLPQISQAYENLENIYNTSYSLSRWNEEIARIFPETSRVLEKEWEKTSFDWVIWYDIKDFSGGNKSENQEKGKILVKYINKTLLAVKENTNDGLFNQEEDDEKYILIKNPENVETFIAEILDAAGEYNMFMRIGVSSIQDTNEPFYLHKINNVLKSSQNHVLSKRLGNYLKDQRAEDDWYHSLIITKGILYNLFDEKLPKRINSKWDLLEDLKDQYTKLRGIDNNINFYIAKLKDKKIKTLEDFK